MGTLFAFLTSEDLSTPIREDQLLIKAMNHLGHQVDFVPWQRLENPSQYQGGVLVRTTWDYTEHLDDFLQTLKDVEYSQVPLYNPYRLIRWNGTKSYLRDLELEGVNIPLSFWFEDVSEVQPGLLWPPGSPAKSWVLKPQVSAGARGTHLLHQIEDWEKIKESYQAQDWGPFMIQEYLPAVADQGEISLVYLGGEYSHAVQKRPRGGDFRVQEEHGGHTKIFTPDTQLIQHGLNILALLEERPLYARVDVIPHPDQLKWLLIELELIEPQLFLDYAPESPARLAHLLHQRAEKPGK